MNATTTMTTRDGTRGFMDARVVAAEVAVGEATPSPAQEGGHEW